MTAKQLLAISLILVSATALCAQSAGWPRQIVQKGSTLVYYQPQIDEWKNFKELNWRMAFSLTPAGAGQVVGVMELHGHTEVDNDNKTVLITSLEVVKTNFPSLDPDRTSKMDQLLRTFIPPVLSVSLHEVVAGVNKPSAVAGVPLKNDPPKIVVSYSPAILLAVDGAPVLADIPKTGLQFVINTTWPLFFDKSKSSHLLLVGQQWMTAKDLEGPWSPTTNLPKDMTKVGQDAHWPEVSKALASPAKPGGILPKIFYSTSPAEIILFDGKPIYSKIPGTKLLYSTNTSSYLFLHTDANQYYFLAGGRWFRANALEGPWSFATMDLPADFSAIPTTSPASIVLASVPGTEQAKDAVLLAQVPTVMTIDPATAAAKVKVAYSGEPHFEPISTTPLYYATNTADKVIRSGDVYYLCLQGVWFLSSTPQGPWTVASSVPQVIYTIPPSSPVYNVTYVTQTTASSGYVESSYTAGYVGAFIMGAAVGAIIANGSGYYYPPYIYRPVYGYPVYRPYPTPYGVYGAYGRTAYYHSATGAYGVSRTAYGPYGSATRSASYNPYTGTSTRSASVSTPYGSRSAAQAYNPYTGTYAATKQGSSPTAQWGSSVVSNGNKSAYAQHYSTAQGTVGSVQTSSGAKAIGSSTAYGNAAVGKAANGDMYAGKDGNVYKNTGSGWQSYNNGSWNSVNKPTPAAAQQKTQNYQQPSSGQGISSANQAAAQQRAQTYQQPAANQRAASGNQAAAQQRAPSAQQQPSASSFSRSGDASGSQMQGLQQEAQNRQRGAQQSQRFQQSSGGASRGGGKRR